MHQPDGLHAGQFLTARQIGELFGVSARTVYRWGQQKSISTLKKAGGTFRFSFDEINCLWQRRYTEGLVDRRTSLRSPVAFPIELELLHAPSTVLQARTIDISPDGLKVHIPGLATQLPRGQIDHSTTMQILGFSRPLFQTPLFGVVRRLQIDGQGDAVLGIELSAQPSDQNPAPAPPCTTVGLPAATDDTGLSISEVATLLSVNQGTIFEWIQKGTLQSKKSPAGKFTIPTAALQRFMKHFHSTSPDEERRSEPRINVRYSIQMLLQVPEELTINAVTTDVSPRGLRLLLPTDYQLKNRLQQGYLYDVALRGLRGPLFSSHLNGSMIYYEILNPHYLAVGVALHDA